MKFQLAIGRDDAIVVCRILLQHATSLEKTQMEIEARGDSAIEFEPRACALLDVATAIRIQLVAEGVG